VGNVRARKQGGVTLIELMVAITVLAILIAMAVPSFRDYFEKVRLRGAGDGVIGLSAQARAEAVRLDRDISVALVEGADGWCVGGRSATEPAPGDPVMAADPCDCNIDPAECVAGGTSMLFDAGAYRGVEVVSGGLEATFDRKLGALASADATQVELQSPSGRFRIRIDLSPLGHARTCVPAGWPFIGGGVREC
jgi:type IV fimbrial biogenesis protein FimT